MHCGSGGGLGNPPESFVKHFVMTLKHNKTCWIEEVLFCDVFQALVDIVFTSNTSHTYMSAYTSHRDWYRHN